MRSISNARWADVEHTAIIAEIDGVTYLIPDDLDNRDRREIEERAIPIAPCAA